MSSQRSAHSLQDDADAEGITLPSEEILALSFENAELPIDTKLLKKYNPFGPGIFPSPTEAKGFEVEEIDGRATYSSENKPANRLERATIEFVVHYQSIGMPIWIIDGIRPTITVSAVLARCDADGPSVTAKIGVCRIDGMTAQGNYTMKESIDMGVYTVESGQAESRFEVAFDATATEHGHPVIGGSDGLRIAISTRDKIRFSDVRIRFQLPNEVPAQFSDWLAESRELRESRARTGTRPCIAIGLFGQ